MKLKVFTSIILIIILITMFYNYSYAATYSDVITGGDNFLQAGQTETKNFDSNKLKDTSNSIYNILLTTGIIAAVIISSILGIKFMIGSAEEKAQVKDALIPFVIGCVVIFGAFGIWQIFIQIGNNFIK